MGSLILIGLYFLFIANNYVEGMAEIPLELEKKYFLTYIQMIAGVLVLNSFSVSVGSFSVSAHDFESRLSDAFLLSKVSSFKLLLSYTLTSAILTFSINVATLLFAFLIIGFATGFWLSAATILLLMAALILISITSSGIILLLTVFVRNSTAFGVIPGVASTFLGFLCGIYMPYSMLGSAMKYVGSLLPYTHLTVLMKQIVLSDASVGNVDLGIFSADSVGFLGLEAPLWVMVIVSCLFAAVCFISAIMVQKKRMQLSANKQLQK
jgi:multidrug/hemolysin transport system permease protein